jgi:hypothetical protein
MTRVRPADEKKRAEHQEADRAHDSQREPPAASPAGSAVTARHPGVLSCLPGMI